MRVGFNVNEVDVVAFKDGHEVFKELVFFFRWHVFMTIESKIEVA